jgi:hypothetical protein
MTIIALLSFITIALSCITTWGAYQRKVLGMFWIPIISATALTISAVALGDIGFELDDRSIKLSSIYGVSKFLLSFLAIHVLSLLALLLAFSTLSHVTKHSALVKKS